ncbi:hypothetical protein M404DRAFT_33763 [Pisolithus tinctorius Marx 270]|uniref:Uncharacterized protein n=1 Tax=Pisolithus tinctorius Marx 270 TaxID=870435 RepID=A0A0C3NKR9_PISTI|nr:hypothetical protein M404DRAFT_33763 [Pisolithus tinctorius Marx 270]
MAPCAPKEKQKTLLATSGELFGLLCESSGARPTDSLPTEQEAVDGLSPATNQLYNVKGVPAMISTTALDSTLPSSTTEEMTQHVSNEIDDIISMLKTNTLTFYGTTVQLASHAEFFQGGFSSDITVMKDSRDETMELLISGIFIFQVDCQNFFMGPEGVYMPLGAFKQGFLETKLSCQLIAVQQDATFKTACADFPAIVGNIRGLERLIPSKKGMTLVSCIREANGVSSIRVSHLLFMKKDDSVDPDTASLDGM